jgi:CBS-domain-containing membrane protein
VDGTKPIYNTEFESLRDSDTVIEATRRMLGARIADLPTVDDHGHLRGMFRLDCVLAHLLPKGARVGEGLQDLAFMRDDVGHLRDRMREVADRPVRDFLVPPAHTVRPDTSPVEIILLLFKGQNNVPVVDEDGRLVGMASAREILAAIQS